MGRRSSSKAEYETWNFRVDDWDSKYTYSNYRLGFRGREPGLDAQADLTLSCTVTYPDAQAGAKASLSFWPDRRIDSLLLEDHESLPHAIGHLNTRKNNIYAYIPVPWEGHGHIFQMVSTGVFKYVQLHGMRVPRQGIEVQTLMLSRKDPAADERESTRTETVSS